ncbi:MAG: dihydrolipoamide acetyltransferase family protein [Bacteroidales bacterium]
MAVAVLMPRQGQSVETCIITSWHKSKGDKVSVGDILFSYETDKAAFEEEATVDGVLLDIFYDDGDEVPVLETVAVIGKPGEKSEEAVPGKAYPGSNDDQIGKSAESGYAKATPGKAGSMETGTANHPDEAPGEKPKLRISPLARKLAKEYDLDLSGIKGTGPHGRIIERDIKKAVQGIKETAEEQKLYDRQVLKSSEPPEYKTGVAAGPGKIPEREADYTDSGLSNMRRIIATKMGESLQNSAQLTHHMSADARKMLAWRKQLKTEKESPGTHDISINDMVCFAVINALKKHPFMNSHFLGNGIRTFHKVHLGIAVDTDRGLMVPVIRDAGDLNINGLSGRIKALAEDCRKGSVDPGLLDSEAASFTVSNLGAYGVEMFTPVINLPQVGILGVNTITYRPSDMGDGVIGFVPVIGLSLTYDHRAVDGAPASIFLAEIKKEIENIKRS